jgi:Tol biopolymer transport system component
MTRMLLLSLLASLVLAAPASAAFPGHNGRIAFVRDGNLVTVDSNGKGLKTLTHDSLPAPAPGMAASGDASPQWSPDGKQLAYAGPADASDAAPIGLARATGGAHLVSGLLARGGGGGPAWAPSGRQLVFPQAIPCQGTAHGCAQIVTASLSGQILGQVTRSATAALEPAYAPKGGLIAFVIGDTFIGDRRGNLQTIRADGSGSVTLVKMACTDPSFSPDGKRIVFSATADPLGGDREIYVVGAHGGTPKQLTHLDGADTHPEFSPDGKRIVFAHAPANGDAADIYVMSAAGTHLKPLTSGPQDDVDPAWQPLR